MIDRAQPQRLYLDTPVTYLKGVGPVRADALRRLGVITAGDLLFHVPHRYEDATTVAPISSLEPGMQGTVIGTVISKGVLPTRKGLRIFQAVLRDDSGMMEVAWPGQPFLDRSIAKGDVLLVTGTVRFYHGRQLQPREFINLGDEGGRVAEGRVLSVYPATEGLSFKIIRSVIDAHLEPLLALVTEYLPRDVLRDAGVPGIADALRMVHRPSSITEAMVGRSRLAFEELFFVQLLQQRAREMARVHARRHHLREQARAHDRAETVSAVRAHRRAGPGDARDLHRHVQRPANAASSPRRRRQRQDDRRAFRRAAGDGERLSSRGHGADRAAGRAARADNDDAARAVAHRAGAAHRQPFVARPQGDCAASRRRRAGAGRRDARAGAGVDDLRQARASRRSTSSIASASSSARRSLRRGNRPTCCSCRRHPFRARSRSRSMATSISACSTSDRRDASRSRRRCAAKRARAGDAVRRPATRGREAGLRRLSGDRGIREI